MVDITRTKRAGTIALCAAVLVGITAASSTAGAAQAPATSHARVATLRGRAASGHPSGRIIWLQPFFERAHGVSEQLLWVRPGSSAHMTGLPGHFLGLAVRTNTTDIAVGSPDGFYLGHADGRLQRHVRPSGVPTLVSVPAWSPDGHRLAFLAARTIRGTLLERALCISDGDGRNARQLLDGRHTGDLLTISWSPDGRTLLLSRFDRGRGAISILNLTTRRDRLLTNGFDAVWSPDGRQIAFDRRDRPGTAQVWLMNVRSHRILHLATRGLTQAAVPVWAPDGRSLAFFGTTAPTPTFVQPYNLWVVSAAGGRPAIVAPNAATILPIGQGSLAWTAR